MFNFSLLLCIHQSINYTHSVYRRRARRPPTGLFLIAWRESVSHLPPAYDKLIWTSNWVATFGYTTGYQTVVWDDARWINIDWFDSHVRSGDYKVECTAELASCSGDVLHDVERQTIGKRIASGLPWTWMLKSPPMITGKLWTTSDSSTESISS